jgi:hypothetical protein
VSTKTGEDQIEGKEGLHILTALGTLRQDIALQPAQIPEAEALRLREPIHEYAQRRDVHVLASWLACGGRRVASADAQRQRGPWRTVIEKVVGERPRGRADPLTC